MKQEYTTVFTYLSICAPLRSACGGAYFIRHRSSGVIFTSHILPIGSHQPDSLQVFYAATLSVFAFVTIIISELRLKVKSLPKKTLSHGRVGAIMRGIASFLHQQIIINGKRADIQPSALRVCSALR